MFIGTYRTDIEVGKIIDSKNLTDYNLNKHENIPIFIIREATYEEWLEHMKENNADISNVHLIDRSRAKFYEVSVD